MIDQRFARAHELIAASQEAGIKRMKEEKNGPGKESDATKVSEAAITSHDEIKRARCFKFSDVFLLGGEPIMAGRSTPSDELPSHLSAPPLVNTPFIYSSDRRFPLFRVGSQLGTDVCASACSLRVVCPSTRCTLSIRREVHYASVSA